MTIKHHLFPWPVKIPLLGIGISLAGKVETLDLLSLWLKLRQKGAVIVTANAEILLWAHEHPAYRQLINQSPLVTVDGFGVICALLWQRFLGKIPQSFSKLWQLRFTGRQLLEDICLLAPQKKWTVFLLGGEAEDVAQKTAIILSLRYSSLEKPLKIFSWPGPRNVAHETPAQWRETQKRINKVHPDFLFIAFGFPKPEMWLAKHASALNFGVAVGLGGVFNDIVGFRPAAPLWLNRLGLESFWRLVTQPRRFRRVLRALFKFPLAVISSP